jgi:hypothetical protein
LSMSAWAGFPPTPQNIISNQVGASSISYKQVGEIYAVRRADR